MTNLITLSEEHKRPRLSIYFEKDGKFIWEVDGMVGADVKISHAVYALEYIKRELITKELKRTE